MTFRRAKASPLGHGPIEPAGLPERGGIGETQRVSPIGARD